MFTGNKIWLTEEHQETSHQNENVSEDSRITGKDMAYLTLGTAAIVGIWFFPYTYPFFFKEYDPREGELLNNALLKFHINHYHFRC